MSQNNTNVEYMGMRLDSTIEKRWLAFFTALKIDFNYNTKETFYEENSGVPYRPDIYFPEYDLYAEIKTEDHDKKFGLFDAGYKISGTLLNSPLSQSNGLLILGNLYNLNPPDSFKLEGTYLHSEDYKNKDRIVCSLFEIRANEESGYIILHDEILGISDYPLIPMQTTTVMKAVQDNSDKYGLMKSAFNIYMHTKA